MEAREGEKEGVRDARRKVKGERKREVEEEYSGRDEWREAR